MSDDNAEPGDLRATIEAAASGDTARPYSGDELRRVVKAYPRVQAAIDNDQLESVIARGLGGHMRLTGDAYDDVRALDQEIKRQEREGDMPRYEPPKPMPAAERKQFQSENMEKLNTLGDLMTRAETLVAVRDEQKKSH